MSHRSAKLVSVIFAGVVAATAVATLSAGAARADECLSAPKEKTPEGSHWYYRIDRATKHHCWYLRDEAEKLTQTAPPNPSLPAQPAAPKPETQRSISDAHAELPDGIEPLKKDSSPFPAIPALAGTGAAATDAQAPQSVIASRWPEASSVSPAITPEATRLAAAAPSNATAAPPAETAEAPLAAADSSQGRAASMPMLLAVMTGALALAGITATIVFKLGGARPARIRVRREHIWRPEDNGRIARSNDPVADLVSRRAVIPRDLDRPAVPNERRPDVTDANERIAEFFAQLTGRAPS
jgi:hypothetical protein